MSVFIDNRQEKLPVDSQLEALAEKVVQKALEVEAEEDYEVSISFVDNEEIRELNRRYRDKNSATDVLSFPLLEFEQTDEDFSDEEEYIQEEQMLGDIVISLERAKEQAEEYGHSFEREVAFLLVHGVLHLLGMDHENEAEEKQMRQKQDHILSLLQIVR
jgi:probable rRNA maturation factor